MEAGVDLSGRLLLWALLPSWLVARCRRGGCCTGLLPAVAGEGRRAAEKAALVSSGRLCCGGCSLPWLKVGWGCCLKGDLHKKGSLRCGGCQREVHHSKRHNLPKCLGWPKYLLTAVCALPHLWMKGSASALVGLQGVN